MNALTLALAVLVLIAGGWAVVARSAFAAVSGFIVCGLLLALVWMLLGAPDVALTEAAIGGGLTGALLLGACGVLQDSAAVRNPRPVAWQIAAALLSLLVACGLGAAFLLLPDPAPGLGGDVRSSMAATGLENPVTAVLLAFRAWDTLLEKVVVLLALVGVWSFAPDSLWAGRPGVRYRPDPRVIFLAQILCPIGIVVGVYLFWVGASAPGGAFQCATIFAALWVLVTMAGLADFPPAGRPVVRISVVAGAVVFAGIGMAGVFWAGAFLAYPADFAKPLILLIEAALTLSVAFTLGLLVAGSPARGDEP